ncbi:hypothetical protein [Streptomyces spectabilis]|uniref:Uncharacterized protein n=1 Tax=Streptomyces spectabilis TaxID=68270 RepID=A0A5P2XI22_STRST|nr:hypothetical protein [Streptomyces spectabilis]MBB5102396.1 hypothetical protein [Streptomyces spectabilis]MCI3907439.1 hypothetical protein [Streptomyces spectabilis]QEV64148.1 hypothetical protein CP982_40180 [Streptomyces spectabilis]
MAGIDVPFSNDEYRTSCRIWAVLLIIIGFVGLARKQDSFRRGTATIVLSFLINSSACMALGSARSFTASWMDPEPGAGLVLTSVGSLVALFAGVRMTRAGASQAPYPVASPQRFGGPGGV